MRKNIGSVDRLVRAVAGIAIIVAGMLAQSWWGLLGLLPLLVAAVGYCPPYALFGINTAKADSRDNVAAKGHGTNPCCPGQ
jgi:hypothetical protein